MYGGRRGWDLDHRQRRIEQADVDDLAFAGTLAMPERRERSDCRVQRGVTIDHRRGGADRLAVALAGQGHETAHRLTQRIEGRALGVGTVLPEAGHRNENDAGVQLAQALVAEAHLRDHTRAEVLEDDVRLFDERGEYPLPARVAKVEADTLLAAVVNREVDALAAHHRRMRAGLLTARRLDLDDLGAEVG